MSCKDSSYPLTFIARRFRIPFSQYFAAQAWNFVCTKSYAGWQFNLQPYISREDCAAFHYARKGNVSSLVELFQQGDASPHDHDAAGFNLLHVSPWILSNTNVRWKLNILDAQFAMESGNADMIRLLASHGVDIFELAMDGITPFMWGTAITYSYSGAAFHRFLRDEFGLPASQRDIQVVWELSIPESIDTTTRLKLLLGYDPAHYERSISARFSHWDVDNLYSWDWRISALKVWLRPDGQLRRDDITSTLREPVSVLHWLSFHFGRNITHHDKDEMLAYMSEVLNLCRPDELHALTRPEVSWMNDKTISMHTEIACLTPLFEFLRGMIFELRDVYARSPGQFEMDVEWYFWQWLEAIQRTYGLGFLETYGKMESQVMGRCMGQNPWVFKFRLGLYPDEYRYCTYMKLAGFKYGANLRDWHLVWHRGEPFEDRSSERVAGMDAIGSEAPVGASMPGSWVEDASDGY